jgi:iron(II)-dependent oxidoreductase
MIATALGYGGWVIFTRRSVTTPDKPPATSGPNTQHTPASETGIIGSAPKQEPQVAAGESAPAGLVSVPGGEVILGGDDTKEPVQKAYVEAFAIGETEVTNAEYAVFVEETKHKPAAGWKGGAFASGTAQEPVTGVTWHDASDYCGWLGRKLGTTARLPTEAEWTRAARSDQNYKYPWGNEWRDGAAASGERRVRAVKSYPTGVSPFGAYDMAGNVWEWVADDGQSQIPDEAGQTQVIQGKVRKGGAALEKIENISAVARGIWPPDRQNDWLGFRCIVPRAESK